MTQTRTENKVQIIEVSCMNTNLKCHYDENFCISFSLFLVQMYLIGLDKCELL